MGCKTSSTVDWRCRAPGKPDSNEEKNSNPIPETVLDFFQTAVFCPSPELSHLRVNIYEAYQI